MTTQTALPQSLFFPAESEFEPAPVNAAVLKLTRNHRRQASDRDSKATDQAIDSSYWTRTTESKSTSVSTKTGAFALVVLAHIVVLYALSQIHSTARERQAAPLQIVSIVLPQSAEDVPPPPAPLPRMPEFELPAVPEIEIEVAVADSNAITVAAMPVASAAASPTIASVTTPKLVSEVEYVREPVAKYPAAARTMKQSGVVTLRVLIDASGRAREVNVHRSSGYKLLDDAARKAVLSALFKPYTENGSAQPVYVLIPIEFGTA